MVHQSHSHNPKLASIRETRLWRNLSAIDIKEVGHVAKGGSTLELRILNNKMWMRKMEMLGAYHICTDPTTPL